MQKNLPSLFVFAAAKTNSHTPPENLKNVTRVCFLYLRCLIFFCIIKIDENKG